VKPDDQIRIRPFSSDDYESIVDLWRSSGLRIKTSDSLSELEKLCAFNPNRFLLAESNGEAGPKRTLGTVIGAFDGRRAWIYHLAVVPDARRLGVGKLLMREIESHLRVDGAIKVNLLVEPENLSAAQFCKGLGYSEVPFIFFTRLESFESERAISIRECR
jgi:ribosomal protein S18 acetylase RimI-like enzyme